MTRCNSDWMALTTPFKLFLNGFLYVKLSNKLSVFSLSHFRKKHFCCNQVILRYSSGVVAAKKTLAEPPHNYRTSCYKKPSEAAT
jgi:hypothetical protein